MTRTLLRKPFCHALAMAAAGWIALACAGWPAVAQQPETRSGEQQKGAQGSQGGTGQAQDLPANTTIVPRSSRGEIKGTGGPGQLSLSAALTDDGQVIEQGLIWRVYRNTGGAEGKARLVAANREAAPTLRLDSGDYFVIVTLGRAHLTRKVTVAPDKVAQERFVLNAGGLQLMATLGDAEAPADKVSYDVLSDERDQYGQRLKIAGGLKPGVVVRMNAGIYSIVSTYGDANAVARSDVTVEAGKLTVATLNHAAAVVTLKLVTRSGGDALSDTQWSIATAQGEAVKDSAGAIPTHILAPGNYTVTARQGGQTYVREFSVKAGDAVTMEVVIR
jgi:hypothetical protein